MTRLPLVVIAALCVAALAWIGLFGPAESPAAPPTDGALTTTPSVLSAAAGSAAPAVPPPRTPAPPDAAWWTEGLVEPALEPLTPPTDAEGGTLRARLTVREQPWLHPQGLEVRVTRCWLDTVLPLVDDRSPRTPLRDEPTTHTDAEGRFALRLLPRAGELFFLIGRGSEWTDFQRIARLPHRGEDVDLGDVWLEQRGGVTGVVRDGGGRPLANVRVRAVDDPLLDPDVGFEDLRAERTRGLELFQARGTTTRGAMPDWVVRRDAFLPFPEASTDRAGRFRVAGLRPGTHKLCLTETTAGQVSQHGTVAEVLVAPGRDTDVGDVHLRGSTPIEMRFVDENGKPWIGAEVAFVQKSLGFGSVAVPTDREGHIEVWVPQGNAARLAFAYPGGGPWLDLGPWDGEATLRVQRPPPLRVLFADVAGKPIRGGQVRAYVVGDAFRPVDRLLPRGMQPVPESDGAHVGVLPCPLVLVAAVPGYAPAIQAVSEAGVVTLTLLPLLSMTVATHDIDGRPVADATIRIQVHENPLLTGSGMQWTALVDDRVLVGRTDANGELRVPCWDTGFSLQATHPDFAPSAGARLPAADGGRREVLLRRRAQLFGTVTVEGSPAPQGLRVRVRQHPPDAHELAKSGFLDEQVAVVGEAGAFACRDLSAGFWTVTPELPASPLPTTATPVTFRGIEVLLSDGQELHCVVEAQRDPMTNPVLRGTVRRDGTALAGALVRIRPAADDGMRARNDYRRKLRQHATREQVVQVLGADETTPEMQRTTTDLTGAFAFAGLEPGRDYELRFDLAAAGRLQFLARRTVRSGTDQRPATSDLDLTTGGLRISCVRAATPFANRMLRLRQVLEDGEEGARYDVLLDAMGEVVLDDLPAGRWSVEPTHGGDCNPALLTVRAGRMSAEVVQVAD